MKKKYLIISLLAVIVFSAGCKMSIDHVEDAARTWITALANDNFERFAAMTHFEELRIKIRETGNIEQYGVAFQRLDTDEARDNFRKRLFKKLREEMYNNRSFFNAVDLQLTHSNADHRTARLGFRFRNDPRSRYHSLGFWQNFSTKEWLVNYIEY